MHATEVTVAEYCEFLMANGYDRSLYPDYRALGDSTYQWIFDGISSTKGWNALTRKIIQTHPGPWKKPRAEVPLNNPVVGITYEQALRYCAWKEADINKDRPDYKKIKVALPAIGWYQTLIPAIDSITPSRKFYPCLVPTFNYKYSFCVREGMDPMTYGHALVRADAYWPTKEGLYNLEGNAAEMTPTKGIAMGGSFQQYAGDCTGDHQQSYAGPQDWLSFRYIVTLR
jgi:hypothetical protein